MTLPSSGALSMSQINAEFGRGNNLNAYRGTTWYTDAGGSGTFSSGAISFSEFYGKRLTSPTFSFTISTNQVNANLRSLAIAAGWSQSGKVIATIASGVVISSSSTANAALTINGSFPGGVDLVNNGIIVGMGGAGGAGRGISYTTPVGGSAGSAGGAALSVSVATSVTNNGTLAGGGGGGGGGGATWTYYIDKSLTFYNVYAGGGGGGGRPSLGYNSQGGAGGSAQSNSGQLPGSAGSMGVYSTGAGAGGDGGGDVAIQGGSGGAWGVAGFSGGTSGENNFPGFSGGAGGAAVSGNVNITWVATGTRYGAIS